MQKKYQRLLSYSGLLCLIGLGVWLILKGMRDNVVFYVTPSEFIEKEKAGRLKYPVRLGGRLREGTLHKTAGHYIFEIEDPNAHLSVQFTGIVPQLFKEGQTIVVRLIAVGDQVYIGDEVLAKHDENYQPPPFRNKK